MAARAAQLQQAPPQAGGNAYLLVPILLLFALLVVAVLRAPNLISPAGIGGAVLVAAPLVLSTYALMATAMAGRGTVDLSIGPLLGFINVTLVQFNGIEAITSPLAVFAYVIAVGVAYQVLMALIILFVRVQPIIVALSGYLALSGINLVILPRPGGVAPEWMVPWGLATSIFSPVLAIVVLCTAAWLAFTRTAFYGHLKLMGSDERAAYTAGVRIHLVRIGAHVISGIYIGLAALCYTALIGSGDPTQGTTYTLISVTALVLGGASLAGGRGGVIGSLLGALNLFLIGYVLATFSFGGVQGFVTDLAYGVILVLSLLLTVALPYLERWLRRISPFLVFVVLGLAFSAVMLHAKYDGPSRPDTAQAPAAAMPQVERPATSFILEQADEGLDVRLTPLQRQAALAALFLFATVLFLRALVAQARTRRFTPLMYVSLAAIILLGAWVLAETVGWRAGAATS